jgi:hypothetical protein
MQHGVSVHFDHDDVPDLETVYLDGLDLDALAALDDWVHRAPERAKARGTPPFHGPERNREHMPTVMPGKP